MKTIKIIKSRGGCWYNERIGYIFIVKDATDEMFDSRLYVDTIENYYEVIDTGNIIHKDDCEELITKNSIINTSKRGGKQYTILTNLIEKIKQGEEHIIIGQDYVTMSRKHYQDIIEDINIEKLEKLIGEYLIDMYCANMIFLKTDLEEFLEYVKQKYEKEIKDFKDNYESIKEK